MRDMVLMHDRWGGYTFMGINSTYSCGMGRMKTEPGHGHGGSVQQGCSVQSTCSYQY